MILNTNISWDYREFSSTNLGYLVDNCSGLLTNIWAFTVCFPVEMVDTGLGHTPLESQFSGDGSSELQRAFYKEEREEEWDSEQEGSMLKGSRLPRGCVFWGVLFFGSLPLWKHCSWPYYLLLPSLTHKGNAHCYYSRQHDDLKPWISAPSSLSTQTPFKTHLQFLSCSTRLDVIWSLIRFLFQTYQLPVNREIKRGRKHASYLICTRAITQRVRLDIWTLNVFFLRGRVSVIPLVGWQMVLRRNRQVPKKSHWHRIGSSGIVGNLRLLETPGGGGRKSLSPWFLLLGRDSLPGDLSKQPSAGQVKVHLDMDAHLGLFSGS